MAVGHHRGEPRSQRPIVQAGRRLRPCQPLVAHGSSTTVTPTRTGTRTGLGINRIAQASGSSRTRSTCTGQHRACQPHQGGPRCLPFAVPVRRLQAHQPTVPLRVWARGLHASNLRLRPAPALPRLDAFKLEVRARHWRCTRRRASVPAREQNDRRRDCRVPDLRGRRCEAHPLARWMLCVCTFRCARWAQRGCGGATPSVLHRAR